MEDASVRLAFPAPTSGEQYAFIYDIFDYNYAETSTWLFGVFS